MHPALLEVRQQVAGLFRLGDKVCLPQDAAEGHITPALAQVGKQVLGVEKPLHVVDRLLVYRDARVTGLHDRVEGLEHGRAHVQGHYVDAGHHHLAGQRVLQIKDGEYHLLLFFLDHAFLLAGIHQGFDLLLGDKGQVAPGLGPKETGDDIAEPHHQVDHGHGNDRDDGQRRGQPQGQALAVLHCDRLGNQLGQDEHDVGRHEQDQYKGNRVAGLVEPGLQGIGQGRGRDHGHHAAGEETGQHHAQLGGRQQTAGILRQALGRPGRAHAFLDQLPQPRLAYVDQGRTRHG